jgi:hypothetical protein
MTNAKSERPMTFAAGRLGVTATPAELRQGDEKYG